MMPAVSLAWTIPFRVKLSGVLAGFSREELSVYGSSFLAFVPQLLVLVIALAYVYPFSLFP